MAGFGFQPESECDGAVTMVEEGLAAPEVFFYERRVFFAARVPICAV